EMSQHRHPSCSEPAAVDHRPTVVLGGASPQNRSAFVAYFYYPRHSQGGSALRATPEIAPNRSQQ
ncbi:MAG: hypothetical protein V1772_10020, partial [Chloroflexota bacterium]